MGSTHDPSERAKKQAQRHATNRNKKKQKKINEQPNKVRKNKSSNHMNKSTNKMKRKGEVLDVGPVIEKEKNRSGTHVASIEENRRGQQ